MSVPHKSISITPAPSSPGPSIESNPRVHFADSIEDDDEHESSMYRSSSIGSQGSESSMRAHYEQSEPGTSGYQPQETVRYSPIYLCPQENFKLTRSSPSSPAGSNVSIVGSLASPRKTHSSNSSGGWKLRTRYSKRRGQERSCDRERQPSVCSDSETDSLSGAHVMEDLCLATPNTTKKWSLPLPMVTRSSESDSASSSWSARSADEGTEDERSPVPSPSASTHSDECTLDNLVSMSHSAHHSGGPHSPKSLKAVELETRKLAIKAKETEEFVYKTGEMCGASADSDGIKLAKASVSGAAGSSSSSKDKSKSSRSRKKKMSRAAESHNFQRMKTTNYGRCKICDGYVYFWGFECNQCELICHKKCLKKMAIMCPQAPLPPRSSILNLDIEALSASEKVPLLVVKCTSEIERRSITRPGIYRMTGVASRVEKLLKSFESGPHLIDLSDVSANDLTSVLKVFLRELKDPLITNDIYKDFIDIGRIYRHEAAMSGEGTIEELVKQLRLTVVKLTTHRLATLRHMIGHLNRVASCVDQNSMTAGALGIIFAPTIFRPRDTINDLYTEVFEAAPQARVLELLIRFYMKIFEDPDIEQQQLQQQQEGSNAGANQTSGSGSATGSAPSSANLTSSASSPPLSPPLSSSISPGPLSSSPGGHSHSGSPSSHGQHGQQGHHQHGPHGHHPQHQTVRRTSSTSSASNYHPAGHSHAHHRANPCTVHHHEHGHCLSSSASTFTFD